MGKITIDLKKLWTVSLVLYIICSSAFSYGDLRMLNTYALYFFLGVSALNILLRLRVSLNAAALCMIFYAILSLFSLLYTPTSQNYAMETMYDYITMVIIVLCVIQYIESMEDIKTILTSYMLAGLALAIYVYAQYGEEFWDLLKEIAESEDGSINRVGGELTNVNTIAMFTIISALIAAFNAFTDRTSKLKTVCYIVIAVICFVISMMAASKKSVILLLVAFACIWLYSSWGTKNANKQVRSLLLLVAAVVVLLQILYTVPIFSSIVARLEDVFGFLSGEKASSSTESRYYYMSKGLNVWLDDIFFGDGFAASRYHFGTYSHNNFVEILMNTGLIGFVLFYTPYLIYGIKYLTNISRYKQASRLSTLLFALFAALTVCSFAFVYYYERYYMILFAVIFSATKFLNASDPKVIKEKKHELATKSDPAA